MNRLANARRRAWAVYDAISSAIAWSDPLLIALLIVESAHLGFAIWFRCS